MAQERPKQLVKYLSVASGLQALESQALQWSSPNAFLSPFEINGRMTLSFSTKELLDSTVKNATAMIFAENRPQGETPLIAAINRWRDEQRFDTPDEAVHVLRDLLGKMVAPLFIASQLHRKERWILGLALLPRGEVGLIVAGIGLSQQHISHHGMVALKIMTLMMALLLPLLLPRFRDWPVSRTEV